NRHLVSLSNSTNLVSLRVVLLNPSVRDRLASHFASCSRKVLPWPCLTLKKTLNSLPTPHCLLFRCGAGLDVQGIVLPPALRYLSPMCEAGWSFAIPGRCPAPARWPSLPPLFSRRRLPRDSSAPCALGGSAGGAGWRTGGRPLCAPAGY